MKRPRDISTIPNDTVRIGRGGFEIFRHVKKSGKIEYSDLIDHLLDVGAYGPYKQHAEIEINKLIKAGVIEQKATTLRLTDSGKRFLEVLELMLKGHSS